MIKRFSGLIMLVIMLMCSVILSVTYSKFLLSKEVSGTIKVPEVDYCIRKNITNLAECMLVMENSNEYKTVEAAKLGISAKQANLKSTAPLINYALKSTEVANDNGLFTELTYMVNNDDSLISDTSETGMFLVSNYKVTAMNENYVGYYTCGGYYYLCSSVYKINEVKYIESLDVYRVVKATKYYYSAVDSFDSEIGLYAAEDDYGTSYYYRGNVKNNFLTYAGYTWRIVRQNGDGTIRVVYSGKTPSIGINANVFIGTSKYNNDLTDPTYVGYMYGEDFGSQVAPRSYHFGKFNGLTNYYFADSYEFDSDTKLFSLKGNMALKNWKNNYNEIISSYPYSCISTSSTGTCKYLVKVLKYENDVRMNALLYSYSSKSYESTVKNTYDSVMKTYIDTWYQKNILNLKDSNGNLYSSYLSDNIFCNDRSYYSGNGYSLAPQTRYGAMRRVTLLNSPSFKCTNFADRFTVSTTTGNGALKYPIALLTADEVLYAGEVWQSLNPNYYLANTHVSITLSPAYFFTENVGARMFYTDADSSAGSIYNSYVNENWYVRPVVNLRADIKITSGDGTADNPYIITI